MLTTLNSQLHGNFPAISASATSTQNAIAIYVHLFNANLLAANGCAPGTNTAFDFTDFEMLVSADNFATIDQLIAFIGETYNVQVNVRQR